MIHCLASGLISDQRIRIKKRVKTYKCDLKAATIHFLRSQKLRNTRHYQQQQKKAFMADVTVAWFCKFLRGNEQLPDGVEA